MKAGLAGRVNIPSALKTLYRRHSYNHMIPYLTYRNDHKTMIGTEYLSKTAVVN